MTERSGAARELLGFVRRSPAALMQLLVAAARKPTFARIVNCPTYPAPARTRDLAEMVELFGKVLGSSDEYSAIALAKLYTEAYPLHHRKGAGQFFTPAAVAEWGIRQISLTPDDSISDAGSGTGVFAEALVRSNSEVKAYVGIENDPVLALCAAHVLETIDAPTSFKIWYTNFLVLNRSKFENHGLHVPTVVLSNPPFVRFHNLRGRGRILAGLGTSLGIKLAPLSGAGNYFLCKSAELLEPPDSQDSRSRDQARFFFYLPREAAGAAHSRKLREDLCQKQGWQWTERAIPSDLVKTRGVRSNSLALFFAFERRAERAAELPRHSRRGHVVGDVLEVRRGISTGRNSFFVLTEQDARRREIPECYLRRVLPTRVALRGERFSAEDWDALRVSGHPCWLLSLPSVEINKLEPPVQSYLKEGIRDGLHETPTARRLRTWYSLPLPKQPPDLFISYLFRGAPRFVLNSAGVLHLTNILGGRLRLRKNDTIQIEELVASLNATAKAWIEDGITMREYRDGLRKIEPGELQRLPIDSAVVNLVGLHKEKDAFQEPLALFE